MRMSLSSIFPCPKNREKYKILTHNRVFLRLVPGNSPVKQRLVYLRSYYHPAALLFERVKRLHFPDDVWPVLVNQYRA